jgi:glycosyltransferase involved in cell wall biosynthesis
MGDLTVIVPTFNEALNLGTFLPQLIEHCQQKQWNVILVNDGSTDGSKEFMQQFNLHDHVTILHHKLNKGYGAALKTGFAACQTKYVITFDADGQHELQDIDKLFQTITCRDADLVVGSRRGVNASSYYRGIGKSFIRYLAKILMTVPIYDLNSGMKIYRTDLAQKYLDLLPDTMAFSDIITLVFINNRHLVLEEPIRVSPRHHGKSVIGIETAFQTIMEIIHIVILFNPMKIFLPLALFCFFLSGIWGIPLLLHGRGVSMGSLLGVITGILLFMLGLIAEQLSMIRRNQHR